MSRFTFAIAFAAIAMCVATGNNVNDPKRYGYYGYTPDPMMTVSPMTVPPSTTAAATTTSVAVDTHAAAATAVPTTTVAPTTYTTAHKCSTKTTTTSPATTTHQCTASMERCAGAPNRPYVQYFGCCDSAEECIAAPWLGWGRFCLPKPPVCYANGARCMGAENHPFVPYAKCCTEGYTCKPKAGDWGGFCQA